MAYSQKLKDDILKYFYSPAGEFQSKKFNAIANENLRNEILLLKIKGVNKDSQLIWCVLNDFTERPTCVMCGGETSYRGSSNGFADHCSNKCVHNNPIIRDKIVTTSMKNYGVSNPGQSTGALEKRKQTNLERYGVEHVIAHPQTRAKTKATCMERYGVEITSQSQRAKDTAVANSLAKYGYKNHVQSPEIKAKIIKTNLERYGVEYPLQSQEIRDKAKDTCIKRYGYENPWNVPEFREIVKLTTLAKYGYENVWSSPDIRAKIKATNLIKYGYENPMQNPEVAKKQQKSAFKTKPFIFPSGKINDVQGYEHHVLQYLLENTYKEEEINIDTVPIFPYQLDGIAHVYHPDIHIPKENHIIEVKSGWTIKLDVPMLRAKTKAVLKSGYSLDYYIWYEETNSVIILSGEEFLLR